MSGGGGGGGVCVCVGGGWGLELNFFLGGSVGLKLGKFAFWELKFWSQKSRLKMQNFSKNWKGGHMTGTLMLNWYAIGSTDWPDKKGVMNAAHLRTTLKGKCPPRPKDIQQFKYFELLLSFSCQLAIVRLNPSWDWAL